MCRELKVWMFPEQILFNGYDKKNVMDDSTRNHIVAVFQDGTRVDLQRSSIIGGWMKQKHDGLVLQYNMPRLSAEFMSYLPRDISKLRLKKCFQESVDNVVSHAHHYKKCELSNQLSQVFPVLDNLKNLPSLTPNAQKESSHKIYVQLWSQVARYF